MRVPDEAHAAIHIVLGACVPRPSRTPFSQHAGVPLATQPLRWRRVAIAIDFIANLFVPGSSAARLLDVGEFCEHRLDILGLHLFERRRLGASRVCEDSDAAAQVPANSWIG